MFLYLVRHGNKGESEVSSEKPLTKLGRSQAVKVGRALSKITFDEVLVSSYLRARHTFELMRNNLSYTSLETKGDYAEIWGGLVGHPEKMRMKTKGVLNRIKNDKIRFNRLWKRLLTYPYESNILMVGHGNFFRYLTAKFLEINPQKTWNISFDDASVSILAISPDRGKEIIKLNDTSHL